MVALQHHCTSSLSGQESRRPLVNLIDKQLLAVSTQSKYPTLLFFDSLLLKKLMRADKFKQQVHHSANNKLKRLLDILGALVGLVITVIIAIPIAIAMQLDDPGPLLYSQIRCGLNGKPFRIWKFRSMVVDADKLQHRVKNQAQGQIFKNEDDPTHH